MKKVLGVGNGGKTFREHGVADLNFEISVVRGNYIALFILTHYGSLHDDNLPSVAF